eukprot:15491651-Heterocapsa_arctica.AAC.1
MLGEKLLSAISNAAPPDGQKQKIDEKPSPAMGAKLGQMGGMNPQMMQMMGKDGIMNDLDNKKMGGMGGVMDKGGPTPHSAQTGPRAALTAAALAAARPDGQKQQLGETLSPAMGGKP